MLDVIGNVGDGCPRLRMDRSVLRERRVVRGVAELHASVALKSLLPARVLFALDGEQRDEADHHHAPVLRHPREYFVRHVPRRRRKRAGVGMREDDRRLGDVEHVIHGIGRHVGDVHQHPEPVHLPHHFLAELREAAVPRDVRCRIGPVDRVEVRERHVAHAEPPVGAQGAERVVDRVAAFHAEQRGDASLGVRAFDVRGGERERKVARVALDDAQRNVDLLELDTREPARAGIGRARDVHRPELAAHAARAQPLDIGVARGTHVEVVGHDIPRRLATLADDHRQVVVAVDQRVPLEDLARLGNRRVRGVGGAGAERGRSGENQQGSHRDSPACGRNVGSVHRYFLDL